ADWTSFTASCEAALDGALPRDPDEIAERISEAMKTAASTHIPRGISKKRAALWSAEDEERLLAFHHAAADDAECADSATDTEARKEAEKAAREALLQAREALAEQIREERRESFRCAASRMQATNGESWGTIRAFGTAAEQRFSTLCFRG